MTTEKEKIVIAIHNAANQFVEQYSKTNDLERDLRASFMGGFYACLTICNPSMADIIKKHVIDMKEH